MFKKAIVILAVLFLYSMVAVGIVFAQEPEKDDDWQFYGTVYGWLPSIYNKPVNGSEIEIDINDIIDNLSLVVMMNGGVKKNRWGFNVDLIYMDLETDGSNAVRKPGGIRVKSHEDVELDAWVITSRVIYNLIKENKFKVDILAGARYLDLEVDVEVDVNGIRDHEISISDSDDVWDAIVGVSGEVMLNKQWFLPYYLDIGTGDSDLTYNLFGGFGYRFDRVSLMAGWRYMRWEFDNTSAIDYMYISGPIVGMTYWF